jgi:hypothetical protein
VLIQTMNAMFYMLVLIHLRIALVWGFYTS